MLAVAPARAAANKEHQQLMAEIRMLQEQQQQLQQLLGNLTDALKACPRSSTISRPHAQGHGGPDAVDERHRRQRSRAAREGGRHQRARLVGLAGDRGAAAGDCIAPASQPLSPSAPGNEPARPARHLGAGPVPPTSPNPNPVPAGVSPQKMWDQVFDDYTAGRFDLAVLGFQSYIQAYPRTTKART